jgi:hypothetical protein
LGWTPEVFWRTSYVEFLDARRGWVLCNAPQSDEAKALRWQDTLPDDDDDDEVK